MFSTSRGPLSTSSRSSFLLLQIVKLEREGYPLRDVMVWLSKVLLYSLDDLDERVRADVLSDVSEAHAKMVRCNRFSLLQIDALLMRLRMKYNLREIQGIM